jgi:superfamily II DNA or RNA helicase
MFQPPPDERIDMSFAKRRRAGDWRDSDIDDAIERNKAKVMGSPVRHYQMHAPGEPGIVFCRSIKTAHEMADRFKAEGFSASAIDGKMGRAERKRIVRDFGSGDLNIMTSCALVSEGFDIPSIRISFDMNPTLSLKEYLQRCGRSLRLTPGDPRPVVLMDHAGNSIQPGFGFPDDDRQWSLEGTKRRKKSDVKDVPIRQCPKCYACCRISALKCQECGFVFVVASREIKETDGDLVEADRSNRPTPRPKIDIERARADSFDALLKIEKDRGYKPGWAAHVMLARAQKKGKPDEPTVRNASHPAGAGFI